MLAAVMTAEATVRDPHLRAQLEKVGVNDAEARRVAGDLSPGQLAWRPPEGGWGVGDCLEHLTASAEHYLGDLRRAIEEERAAGGEPVAGHWRPTLQGRLLLHGVNSPRRLPAPRKIRPPATPRPEVLAEFLRTQRDLSGLMTAADGVDLRRIACRSPLTRLLRFNLGEVFQILQDHARRHLAQARRVRERPGFPAA